MRLVVPWLRAVGPASNAGVICARVGGIRTNRRLRRAREPTTDQMNHGNPLQGDRPRRAPLRIPIPWLGADQLEPG